MLSSKSKKSSKLSSISSFKTRVRSRSRTSRYTKHGKHGKLVNKSITSKKKKIRKVKSENELYDCSKLKMGISDTDVLHDIICLKIKENNGETLTEEDLDRFNFIELNAPELYPKFVPLLSKKSKRTSIKSLKTSLKKITSFSDLIDNYPVMYGIINFLDSESAFNLIKAEPTLKYLIPALIKNEKLFIFLEDSDLVRVLNERHKDKSVEEIFLDYIRIQKIVDDNISKFNKLSLYKQSMFLKLIVYCESSFENQKIQKLLTFDETKIDDGTFETIIDILIDLDELREKYLKVKLKGTNNMYYDTSETVENATKVALELNDEGIDNYKEDRLKNKLHEDIFSDHKRINPRD